MVERVLRGGDTEMKYYLPDYDETAGDAREINDGVPDEDPYYFARQAAEDFHDFHDGWEASWPIELVVIDNHGVEHLYDVDREMEPVFTASKSRKKR